MKPTGTLTTLFSHNLWANLRLLERCAALSSDLPRYRTPRPEHPNPLTTLEYTLFCEYLDKIGAFSYHLTAQGPVYVGT